MSAPGEPAAFIGRTAEMSRLQTKLKEAEDRRSAVVIVSGESGLGKTRLVTEFASQARGQGATVLIGWCTDFGENGPSYWPILEALRLVWPQNDVAPPASVLAGQPELGANAALSVGVTAAPANPAATASSPLFEMVLRSLRRLAEEAPVLFIIEDLHWADRSTRDLLTFLLASTVGERVMTVLTYRSEALSRRHPLRPLLAEMRRSRRATFLALRPFSQAELVAQLHAILGRHPEADLVDLISARSDGNPFFVEELLEAVADGCGDELPPTLHHILMCRVDGLSDTAKRVLHLVAVATDGVTFPVLKGVSGLSDDELVAALRDCVDHHLLRVHDDGQTYLFRHSLMQEVLYEDLLPGEKQVLHAGFGQVLSELTTPADRSISAKLAWHWFVAGDAMRALQAALDAAAEASQIFGFAEALRHYERALKLWDDVPGSSQRAGMNRAELFDRAADTAYLAGEPRRACDLIAGALAAGPDEAATDEAALRRAVRCERLGHYLSAAGNTVEALRAYQEALGSLPPGKATVEHASVTGAYAEALKVAGRYRASRLHAESALELAQQAGSRLEEAQILATLGFDLSFLGDADSGVEAIERAQGIAEQLGQPDDIGRAYLNRAELLSGPLNRLDEAASVAEAGIARVGQLGLERTYGVALHAVAINILFRLGRWHEADRLMVEAFAARPTGTADINLRLARAKLSVGRGDFEAVEVDLHTVEAMIAGGLGPRTQVPLLTIRAGMDLWRGRPAEARDAAQRGIATSLDASEDRWLLAPLIWLGLWAEADLAHAARARRDHRALEHSLAAVAALWTHIEELGQAGGEGAPAIGQAIAAYRALCQGERARAEAMPDAEAWAQAATSWDALHQPYPAAYGRLREAEALFAVRSRSSRASDALRHAHHAACRLGAVPLRWEIEALAGRARVTLSAVGDGSVGPAVAGPGVAGPGFGAAAAHGGSATPVSPARDRAVDAADGAGIEPTSGPGSAVGQGGTDSAPAGAPEAAGASGPQSDLARLRREVARSYRLSAREMEVVLLLAAGRSNKQISEALFISPKTASVHVTHILSKLGLNTRVQAVALAYQLGLVPPAGPGGGSPVPGDPNKSS